MLLGLHLPPFSSLRAQYVSGRPRTHIDFAGNGPESSLPLRCKLTMLGYAMLCSIVQVATQARL
eukprot:7108479-Pyramimonas_sp.AAC.1